VFCSSSWQKSRQPQSHRNHCDKQSASWRLGRGYEARGTVAQWTASAASVAIRWFLHVVTGGKSVPASSLALFVNGGVLISPRNQTNGFSFPLTRFILCQIGHIDNRVSNGKKSQPLMVTSPIVVQYPFRYAVRRQSP